MPSTSESSPSRAFAPEALTGSRTRLVLCLSVLLFAVSGCAAFSSSNSFSDSSESVSDSVGSSSDSSGSSSDGDDSAYREEVTHYVAVAAGRHIAPEALRRGVTEIALAYGISDWQATPTTREAVDAGLAEASAEDRARYRAAFTR